MVFPQRRVSPAGDRPKERRAINPRTGRHHFLNSSMPTRAPDCGPTSARKVADCPPPIMCSEGRCQGSSVSCPRSLLTRLRLVYFVDEARFVVPLRSWRIRTSSFGSLARDPSSVHFSQTIDFVLRHTPGSRARYHLSGFPEARIKEVTHFFPMRFPPRSTWVTSFFPFLLRSAQVAARQVPLPLSKELLLIL